MVTLVSRAAAQERTEPREADHFERAALLATRCAECAPAHDRDASFPFENFNELSDAGLLALTVPTALGGIGAQRRQSEN